MSIVAQGFGLEAPAGAGTQVQVTTDDVVLVDVTIQVSLLNVIEVVLLSAPQP